MSILVVEVVPQGIIFGADKNITHTTLSGATFQHDPQKKVLKWPNTKTLFGFVGAAKINNLNVEEWLNTQSPDFSGITSLEQIAQKLKSKVEAQRRIDEGSGSAQPMIIHLAGFEQKNGYWLPYVYHITNVGSIGRFGYLNPQKDYGCTEHMYGPLKNVDPSEVRKFLLVQAKQFQPFWFHQGLDLITFNVLESAMKSSFKLLCEQHPDHQIPTTLDDWAKHVRLQILMYGAYYEAFYPVGQRYVGGGVDIELLPWA